MENVIDEIREAEEKAKKLVAEAKKKDAVRLNTAIEESEKAKKDTINRANERISQAIKDVKERAKTQAQEMSTSQANELEKLKSNVGKRMNTAIERITAEFGKWQ